jgi:hypothetical protein
MRTRIKLLTLITVTVIFFSCQKQDLPTPDTSPQSEIISIDIAREVAKKFAQKKFPRNQSKSILPAIEKEETISDKKLPYFYIFNMADKGGFVIVSAERYEHPVLAFGEEGEFKREGAPYGLISWLETTKSNINYIRAGRVDTRKQTTAEWREVVREYGITSLRLPPDPEPGCQDYSVSVTKGPLVTTSWGQGCGYNDFVPIDPSGANCGRYPTGCVATAMAQVMRYWQFPSSYNWGSMATTFPTFETARLMDDIGGAVGMNYATSGSGASHGSIPGAFRNIFGYSTASDIGYGTGSYSTVRSQLSSNRPVLLSGYHDKNTSWFGLVVEYSTGHEWVCDGYIDTDVYWCNPDGTSGGAGYLSFHMNWGWNGTANGWYAFNSWAPYGQGLNFQYYRRAIINIHP